MKEIILLRREDGKNRTIRTGFCWLGFFIPMLWALSEGLWRPCAFVMLSVLLSKLSVEAANYYDNPFFFFPGLIAYLSTMLIFGLYGKKWLLAHLVKQGYVRLLGK
jgi:hypothetical protein